MDTSVLTEIMERYEEDTGAVIAMLQDVQETFNYLPEDALLFLARNMDIPLSRLYSLATFYGAFSLEPRGKHPVCVCTGTACHVRGAQRILEAFERALGISTRGTTPDLNFSLNEVRCLGCCGLAPVVTIGDDLHGKVTAARAPRLLDRYKPTQPQ